jgi:hypothetical protein
MQSERGELIGLTAGWEEEKICFNITTRINIVSYEIFYEDAFDLGCREFTIEMIMKYWIQLRHDLQHRCCYMEVINFSLFTHILISFNSFVKNFTH